MIAIIGAGVFSIVIVLSFLIVCGFPLGELTMGEQYKVFPKKIEDVIISVSCILEVCVVSTNTGNGFAPIAYIVLKKGVTESKEHITENIKKVCEEQLPDYLQPFRYEFLESLPKTSIGKVDYKALEKLAEEKANGK